MWPSKHRSKAVQGCRVVLGVGCYRPLFCLLCVQLPVLACSSAVLCVWPASCVVL
jgi:hypothetical protein